MADVKQWMGENLSTVQQDGRGQKLLEMIHNAMSWLLPTFINSIAVQRMNDEIITIGFNVSSSRTVSKLSVYARIKQWEVPVTMISSHLIANKRIWLLFNRCTYLS